MTRHKEIQKAAKEIAQDIEDWEIAEDIEDAFMEGALWADRTMIDKAVKWLTAYFVDYLNFDEQIIKDFERAMKGGLP